MPQQIFTCSCCPSPAYGIPVLAMHYPDPIITAKQRGDRITISKNHCEILYPKPRRRFVRTSLDIPFKDSTEHLSYGVWVELDAECFHTYRRYENAQFAPTIEGKIANGIPGYENSFGAPIRVRVRGPLLIPLAEPLGAATKLFDDFSSGISQREAELRTKSWQLALHGADAA